MIEDESVLAPRDPVVVSSFYPTPDGRTSVRAYEIKNSNPNIVKIHKDELDEPRFEISVSRAFYRFKDFFISSGTRSSSLTPKYYGSPRTDGLNVKKGMAFHTKRDGGVVAVTSLDLNDHRADNSALKEFVQRKALMDRMKYNQSYQGTPLTPVVVNQGPMLVRKVSMNNNNSNAPCMCLDCQAKIRKGMPAGSFVCNCLDCQNKRKFKR